MCFVPVNLNSGIIRFAEVVLPAWYCSLEGVEELLLCKKLNLHSCHDSTEYGEMGMASARVSGDGQVDGCT